MIEIILLALSPVLVAGLTQASKKVIAFTRGRTIVIRFSAALLSFLSVIVSAATSGGEIDPVSVENFAEAFMVFLGATGVYFFAERA